MDVAEAGRRWLAHLEAIGRRRSTLMDYESAVRVHLVTFFGERPIGKVTPDDVERFMAAKDAEGRSPKSVRNYLGLSISSQIPLRRHHFAITTVA
jgi:hypothetical protein